MKAAYTVGKPFPDRKGRVGARVGVHIGLDVMPVNSVWGGHYHFATHGMSAAEVTAKRDAILDHHAKKAARLSGFGALVDDILVSGELYDVRHCTIVERGTDVELRIRLRHVPSGERININTVYPTIDGVPGDDEIRASMIAAAKKHADEMGEKAATAAAILAALG